MTPTNGAGGTRRVRRTLAGALVALAVVAAACGGGDDGDGDGATDTTAGEPQQGGDLVFGLEADGDGLNPTSNRFAVSSNIMGNAVFDTLTKFDADGVARPFLAESLTPNDDYTAWTIKLRPGITFHDGTPLTSEALKVGVEGQRADPIIGIAVRPVLAENPVTIVDELTATLHLTRSLPYFQNYLTTQLGMVASPTWLKAAAQDKELNQRPVGTGPFKLESRTLDARTKVVRNPDYWREGLPYLDSITFVIATDAQARGQNLRAGDFDIIHTTRDEDILDFREDSSLRLFEDLEGEETFVMLNVSAPPFDDVRPRQVLAHATDRETFVQLVGSGIVPVANSMFHPDSKWYTPTEFPEYDLDEAKRIAAEFCSEKPAQCDGEKIKFEFKTTPSPDNEEAYQTLSEMWKDVASVTKVPVEQAAIITDAALGVYNAVLWRQFGATDPDSDMLWLDSESIGAISLNFARNSDQEIDAWLDEQRVEQDFETRKELWSNINAKLNEDLPFIWLNHTLWGIVATSDVHDVENPTFPDGEPVQAFNNGRPELSQIWMSS